MEEQRQGGSGADQHEQFEARVTDAATGLADELGVDPHVADKLYRAGGVSADMVMQMPADYIAQSIESTEDAAQEILAKARAASGAPAGEVAAESADQKAAEPSESAPAADPVPPADPDEPLAQSEEEK